MNELNISRDISSSYLNNVVKKVACKHKIDKLNYYVGLQLMDILVNID